jgi:HEAT repeat protein
LPPAAFAILADLLGDRDRDLRLAAAEAFGQARDKSAVSVLATALQDKDPFVSQAAEHALTALN